MKYMLCALSFIIIVTLSGCSDETDTKEAVPLNSTSNTIKEFEVYRVYPPKEKKDLQSYVFFEVINNSDNAYHYPNKNDIDFRLKGKADFNSDDNGVLTIEYYSDVNTFNDIEQYPPKTKGMVTFEEVVLPNSHSIYKLVMHNPSEKDIIKKGVDYDIRLTFVDRQDSSNIIKESIVASFD